MSYFENFPQIFYDSKGDRKYTVLTNLLSRVKLIDGAKRILSILTTMM